MRTVTTGSRRRDTDVSQSPRENRPTVTETQGRPRPTRPRLTEEPETITGDHSRPETLSLSYRTGELGTTGGDMVTNGDRDLTQPNSTRLLTLRQLSTGS